MTLQYARPYLLRAGINVLGENGKQQKDHLVTEIRNRKSLGANQPDSDKGAKDIISELQNIHLVIIEESNLVRLSSEDDIPGGREGVFLHTGKQVAETVDTRTQMDRLFTNLAHEYPELIIITKFIFRNGPVKDHEIKREFDGQTFRGNKMNEFTLSMSQHILRDSGVIEDTDRGVVGASWPEQAFAHILGEEFNDLTDGDDSKNVKEPVLFERLETMYGVDRNTFDRLLSRLQRYGIVAEGSYEEMTIDLSALMEAHIYE
ncbi:hypothetical protein [Haladaptatus sp. AB643]|uniref:hypothetical protein n=1 Tax=Haladaptatus sp. AB643 TaxID=2934174 RepID=UPI00209BE98E|nr:hypothetical protein [Haladaptatus sp. AB643]MCO8242980.1 hypothetical protein [Haladaptatus sp. AB643]